MRELLRKTSVSGRQSDSSVCAPPWLPRQNVLRRPWFLTPPPPKPTAPPENARLRRPARGEPERAVTRPRYPHASMRLTLRVISWSSRFAPVPRGLSLSPAKPASA
jgi:hypothetical protein